MANAKENTKNAKFLSLPDKNKIELNGILGSGGDEGITKQSNFWRNWSFESQNKEKSKEGFCCAKNWCGM